MRKLLLLVLIVFLVLLSCAVAAGVAASFAAHWVGSMSDMHVTVDGETLEAPAIAAIVGGAAFFGTLIACLVAFAVVASLAVVIPLVLIAIACALTVALFAGLAPIAIPVLLVVGAYVLLSRRSKRSVALPPTSPAEQPIPHA